MRKQLLAVSAVMLAGISFSQVVLSENFDASSNLPAGWAQYNVDGNTPGDPGVMGTNGWIIYSNFFSGSGKMALSTSFYDPEGTSDDWLVTPSILIPSGQSAVQFDASSIDPTILDGFELYVSTTGNTVADFTGAAILQVAEVPGEFTGYSADLSVYAGQTVYIAIRNNTEDQGYLSVDNFVVRQVAANDAFLKSVTLNRYSLTNTNNILSLKVKNDGGNTITSLDVAWNDGTDHSATISCNITPGSTATVNHTLPVTYATVVEKNISVTITGVNASTDPNTANNSGSAKINTVSQLAEKAVVIEEGTGTWCGWCPRGAVAMDAMDEAHPDDFIGIAVHNNDPMTVSAYNSGAAFTGFPGSNVDRTLLAKPVSTSAFEDYYNSRIGLIVPAGITAQSSGSGSQLTVNVTATFHTTFSTGNYKLAVVLKEDDVSGTASGYNQTNYYAGGSMGDMGGYESLPNPVPAAQMVYNHVGRALLGGYTGQSGTVPAAITDGLTASYSFTYTIPSTMKRDDMHAVALLLDAGTGEIVNAREISISTLGTEEAATIGMKIYPNPATTEAVISFEGEGGEYIISIMDITGKVYTSQIVRDASGMQKISVETAQLAAGTYFVNIANETGSHTQNLIIK